MRPDVLTEKSYQSHQTAQHAYDPLLANYSTLTSLIEKRCELSKNAPFLIYRDGDTRREWSYGDFYTEVLKYAYFMQEHLGLKSGDRVAVAAHNHDQAVFTAFACWLMGYAYVPLNMTESEERINFVIENSECKALFALKEYTEKLAHVKDMLPRIQHFIQISGAKSSGWERFSDKKYKNDYNPLVDVNRETESLVVFTSGTTGKPKGVVLDHGNLLADAHAIAEWFKFDATDRAMTILPIHHVNGLILTLLTVFYSGGSTVLNRKFSASNYFNVLQEERCTFGSVVPTILSFLGETYESFNKPESLKDYFLICGAGPLTVELSQRFMEKFGIKIQHGYGLSETVVYSCYLPKDLSESEYQEMMYEHGFPSIGCAIGCNEMAIHDEEGNALAENERGEIVIRGQNIMQGYFKRPEANAEAFEFGWFRSGDEGFYLTDNRGRQFFFITGRLKELIIRGGVNYAPLEIDEILSGIKGVRIGLAVGFENNFYGEEVGAFIVKEEGASISAEDILSICSENMPRGKCPKVVVFGKEAPVTATGKYQRNKLKHLFIDHKDTQFT